MTTTPDLDDDVVLRLKATPGPSPTMDKIEQAREAREFVARYGGRCRDCADHDGVCPTSGLPCIAEERDRAINHVIEALNYGFEYGFLSPSTPVDEVGAEPRVKPLEWKKGLCNSEVTIEQAYTIGGMVQVRQFENKIWLDQVDGSHDEHESVEAAKAAAQADHERRIFSALASPETEARPIGYLKPEAEGVLEPRFIYADQHTEDWMLEVFTVPVYARAETEARLRERLADEEKEHERTIAERDSYHDWADKLAAVIGGDEIGEHSSLNNPWQSALDIAEARHAQAERAPAVTADMLKRAQSAHDASLEQWRLHPEAPLSMLPHPMHAALEAALGRAGPGEDGAAAYQ